MNDDLGVAAAAQMLIGAAGEDESREGLRDTPARFAKAWSFWTSGYEQKPDEVLKTFSKVDRVLDFDGPVDEMVFQSGIPFYSLCEHHLTPFFGVAHIGYIPKNGCVVGLSKLSRLVDAFSRRLTIQERICDQVADALMTHLRPQGVGVILQARHMCMESRGIQRVGTITVTSALRGDMRAEPECRAEFMSLVTAATQGTRSL